MCARERHRYSRYFRHHAVRSIPADLERGPRRFAGRVDRRGGPGHLGLAITLAAGVL